MPNLREAPDAIVKSAVVDPKTIPIGNRDPIVVLTKGERDADILESLPKTNARFVGLLTSRRRLRKDMEELERRGVRQPFLSRLHAPIGLDVGAPTPPELATSISGAVPS